MNILNAILESLRIERDALEAVSARIGDDAVRAVETIHDAEGQVIVTGMGKAGLIGRKIAATLASTGTPAFFLHPAEAIHGDLGIVCERDVVLALSNSGESEEIVALLPHLKRFGVKIISLTGRRDSTLGRYSDIVLDTDVEREADPIDIAPTASTTVQLAVGDALVAGLIERRGFQRDQYAIFHPGGSLGRKLLSTVRDLMHSGDDLPIVPHTVSLREALLDMTSKRLGATFVVDDDGCLEGILTDGDLRRIIQDEGNPLARPVLELMVSDPKTVTESHLAAEALRIMEDHLITVLPVIDEQQRPIGALHMHDLIKAGLA